MFKPVNNTQNFAELENAITAFWKANHIFEKSVSQRSADNKYVFYDGPPFITGAPHYGSLLPSIAKDVIPRYQTMKGHRVERVWGWDCHGLPIENKVEKALNINNRREIESFGIQKFVDECYKYTRNTSAEWRWYVDKIGRWVDLDNSYKTMDQDYMESVLWVFKQLYGKGKIYEGMRTSLFCTRCGTPISNFEIAMDNSYAMMEDPAVTIKFPVLDEGKFKGANLLAWTTTPWTLPSNRALVLDDKEDYVLAEVQRLDIELEEAWAIKELPANLNKLKRSNITQAYLNDYKDESGLEIKQARLRKLDDKYTFTVKYWAGSHEETGQLIEKTEEINKERYIELIKQATNKVVKIRYYMPLENGLTAEIDTYQNNLKGFNVVEVEYASLSKQKNFKKPDWFGKELTDSNGIYPPNIADMSLDEVNAINEKYQQKPHNYQGHAINEKVILAKKRLDYILENIDYTILETFKGKELLNLKYQPPFNYFPVAEHEHRVYAFKDMVTMEEGTGIVHSAPGFGDVDTEMGKHYKLGMSMSINDEGKYIDLIKDYKGLYVKEADKFIMADLKKAGPLFKQEKITHRYPFCWRCATPLLQKAQPSWFIDIQGSKPELIANNEKINWVPGHLKQGRFKKGIEMAPDWGISRTRYWASPMPVWQRVEKGEVVERVVVGSRDEIRELSTTPITKIVFVRHGERTGEELDAPLSERGHEQARQVAKHYAEVSFDGIYAGELIRAGQTVEPLANAQKQKIQLSKLFGDPIRRSKIEEIIKGLEEKFGKVELSRMPEAELVKAFSEVIADFKVLLSEFLHSVKGQSIIAGTHLEVIAFVRHILEGRNLSECMGLDTDYGKGVTLYFNDTELFDLHRPKIDNIHLKGKTGELTRVKEVLDVWMDSASMPYASKHYPFEDKKDFEENFPADFIIEYIAQTRAWFYVMHVIGTALMGSNSFKNVVTTGVMAGTDGRKMSKSYGNYPDPKIILEKYGAEPLRLYLMGAPIMVGEDINLDEEGLRVQVRDFILPLWNSFSFFITYANVQNWKPESDYVSAAKAVGNELDQWIIAKLNETIKAVTQNFDKYDIPAVVKNYYSFLDVLSKWYIRRSRERFAAGNKESYTTLYYILVEFAKLIAPVTPFLSEALYQNLVVGTIKDAPESIHLDLYPEYDEALAKKFEELLPEMELVREVANLGQAIRAKNGFKVRQPLAELKIVDGEGKAKLTEWMKQLLNEELNINKTSLTSSIETADNWINLASEVSKLSISIDVKITPELQKAGLYRELVRVVMDLRKKAGLVIGQQIVLELATKSEDLLTLLKEKNTELKRDLAANSIEIQTKLEGQTVKVNESELVIKIS